MVADLPAVEKVEKHLSVSTGVKLDTPPATSRISTMVKKKKKGKEMLKKKQFFHGISIIHNKCL